MQRTSPDGTIAKARALFSSIADASGVIEFNPWTNQIKSKLCKTEQKIKNSRNIKYRRESKGIQ